MDGIAILIEGAADDGRSRVGRYTEFGRRGRLLGAGEHVDRRPHPGREQEAEEGVRQTRQVCDALCASCFLRRAVEGAGKLNCEGPKVVALEELSHDVLKRGLDAHVAGASGADPVVVAHEPVNAGTQQ